MPGILLVNRPVRRVDPALVDMAPTILTLFGVPVPAEMVGGDLFAGDGDERSARCSAARRSSSTRTCWRRCSKYAGIAGYATPEEFVQHVLEREIAKFEEGGDSEDEIRKRMQGLGYIS